jgi:hypothetical protein
MYHRPRDTSGGVTWAMLHAVLEESYGTDDEINFDTSTITFHKGTCTRGKDV